MPLKKTEQKSARNTGDTGSPEPEKQAGPITVQPRLEPDEAQDSEPARPYQAFVESEARQFWQEISKVGSLTKPSSNDILFDSIPIMFDATCRALERQRYAFAQTRAMQFGSMSGTAHAMEPGRPYQAFVENEARKYWQETGKEHNLAKPTQQEVREAAMPVLCHTLRNRTGHRRHQAVAGMVQHAYDNGLIRWPFSEAAESPSYIDALIQLADDANWLAREIPLPDHPPPKHPPIYYTIGSRLGQPVPVPREDAVIRGDYLYRRDGSRLTDEKYVLPNPHLPVGKLSGSISSPRLPLTPPQLFYIDCRSLDQNRPIYYGLTFERARKPINCRGVYVWFDWKEERGDETLYFSTHLRDFPYPIGLHFSHHPPDR